MANAISIKEVLTYGWETFKKDPWFYVGVTAALTVFSVVVSMLTDDGYGVMALIGFIISFVASTIVSIAYARMALSATAGAHVDWQGLWAPEHILNMLGSTILQSIIVVVGFILLIVPGVIAALALCFTQLALVDKKLSPVAALKESYRLTTGHKWQLFLLMLCFIVLNIIGAIFLGIGLLVTIPVTLLSVAHVYRTLSAAEEPVVVTPIAPVTPVQ